jgi:hypothetical protein
MMEGENMSHTPIPWEHTGGDIWVDTREQVCCGRGYDSCCGEPDVRGGQDLIAQSNPIDAAFIVRAVNSHEALVRALRAARGQVVLFGGEPNPNEPYHDTIHAAVMAEIDAALALAAPPVEQAKTIIDGAQERHEARSKRLFSDPKIKEALHRRPVEQAKTEVEG